MQVNNLPKFHGVAPALVTPMHQDRSIDWKSLSDLINHVSQGGVDYLVVQGTTGESATTTSDEKKKIVETIKEDFISKTQLHSAEGNDLSVFQIRPGFTMDDLIGQFKIQVRSWGKKEYGTFSLAENKLKLGQGTMKNWTDKKVTQSHRRNFQIQVKLKK